MDRENEDHANKIAYQMMKKMGYKSGSGLGKNEQGILNPVSLHAQSGKQGLGLQVQEVQDYEYDIVVDQKVEWLENKNDTGQHLCYETLKSWAVKGDPIITLKNETNFCDKEILDNMLKGKDVFDELGIAELRKARIRANPFESIRAQFFMNRAALKMANIDAATSFMFTDIDYNPKLKKVSGPYYFADVCAGPGGFSEYILWRKQWFMKGFGFTLKGHNDFQLANSNCASHITFQSLYGAQNDGNIFCPENIKDFNEKVLHETGNLGVHFMMSDGGFSVEGNEEIQEILSKQIYICQCLVALEIVRQDGHFVTKLFDLFTNFSVGLLYLMKRCFEKVSIFKPNASRPANSERYLICYGLKQTLEMLAVREYLSSIVNDLWILRQVEHCQSIDIIQIVPLEVIKSDTDFFSYIYNSNNRLGQRQTKALIKLREFCRNPSLVDTRQEELRRLSLTYWKIPDGVKIPLQCNLEMEEDFILDITKTPSQEIRDLRELELKAELNDWHFSWLNSKIASESCTFFAGEHFSKTLKFNGCNWVKVKNLKLIPGTLLYGELVKENFCSRGNKQGERKTLLVIDALRLGNIDLAELPFEERHRLIETYCEAINHQTRNNHIRIRSVASYPLGSVDVQIDGDILERIYNLPILSSQNLREFYKINSVMLTNASNDVFKSRHLARKHIYIFDESEIEDVNIITIKSFCNFLKSPFNIV